ncbi:MULTISPECIES: YqgE/AlgH family protein [Sphingobacterium]|uniref:YqgE/AlgH family protein n=1 Tax=Sphingobacterium populi TaxID=1812824 RepID=A0ABW5UHA9_9SPHI|nr:YqgE/AlgH family protein [Sphingobacterium sp. CFCC 11742]
MFSEYQPKQGSLLVSEPFMVDQNFERSVVLLCEHDAEDGSVGLILNHRSFMMLSDIVAGVENLTFPVYLGGPMEQNTMYFVHEAYDRLQSGTPVIDNLYWGGDFERLIDLINRNEISQDEVKLFLGYSGWSPDQLESEIQQNCWAVHNTYSTDLAFILDGEDLWKHTLVSLGPKYAHVANFPKRPEYN